MQWRLLTEENHWDLLQLGTNLSKCPWRLPWKAKTERNSYNPLATGKRRARKARYYVPRPRYSLSLPKTQTIERKLLFQSIEVSKCRSYQIPIRIKYLGHIKSRFLFYISLYNMLIPSMDENIITFPLVNQRRPQYVIGPKLAIWTITERYEAKLHDSGNLLTSNGSSTQSPFMLIHELMPNKMARTSINTRRLFIRTKTSILYNFVLSNFFCIFYFKISLEHLSHFFLLRAFRCLKVWLKTLAMNYPQCNL